MASPSCYSPKHNHNENHRNSVALLDPNAPPNTTFVQADPSNFRAVVQKLTGASPESSTPKLPLTGPNRLPPGRPTAGRRPSFKLQERRQSAKKLEIKLNNNNNGGQPVAFSPRQRMMNGNGFFGFNMVSSPVSTLDLFLARGSPRTPVEEEEERAIADKGFYLHPSPLTTPRAADPELLPLFPLHSPHHSSTTSS